MIAKPFEKPVSSTAADWAERARIIALPKSDARSRAMMAWQTAMSQRARQKLIAPLDADGNGAVDAGYEDEFHCRMLGERLRRGQECVAWFSARFDRNGNGAIDANEWPAVAAACPVLKPDPDSVEELVWASTLADSNHDGWMDEGESLFAFRVKDMVEAITKEPAYFLPYPLKKLDPRPVRSIPLIPPILKD